MATVIGVQPAFRMYGIEPAVGLAIVDRLGNAGVTFDPKLNELHFASNLLHDVPWDVYEMLDDSVQHGRFRHTYDKGVLEMMSPWFNHESTHRFISRLLETWSMKINTPIMSAGSTTQRKKRGQQGVEPDSSYYVQNEPLSRARWRSGADLPPPDLAIEVEATSSSTPRLPVYARIGVPEIWRYDGKQLTFLKLSRGGQYRPLKVSEAFPFLEPGDLLEFISQFGTSSQNTLIRVFVAHMKQKAFSEKPPKNSKKK